MAIVSQSSHRSFPSEVVVLGASNVTYGLGVYVRTLTASFESGARLLIGHGHGRSFGRKSRAFFRQLDGHAQSSLWNAWSEHGDRTASRYALITDVGNDLLYGASVPMVMNWVERCLGRLKEQGSETTIVTLPLSAIQSLSRWRFEATARMFFPKTAVSWEQMQRSVVELDDGLRVLASEVGASIVEPAPHWYGFDPIHIRRTRRVEAVREMLSAWPTGPTISPRTSGPLGTLRLWTKRPAQKWIAGRLIETQQPVQSDDGHELWLF